MSVVSNMELLQASRDAAKDTSAYKRVRLLFDEGSFQEIDAYAKSGDGSAEAVAGFGTIDGCPAYVFAQNSDVDGGVMSKVQASKIKKVYGLAEKTGTPVIGIYDSMGARLREGADMLQSFGEILLGCNNLSGVVPQIALVLGPCIGTSAMIAACADIVVMSEKGELTVSTAGENSSAAAAAKNGLCQILEKTDEEAIAKVRALITTLPSNNLSGAPVTDALGMTSASALNGGEDMKTIVESIVDDHSLLELSPEFGSHTVAALAQLTGSTVGVIGYTGEICANACSKAARFVRFCDAFGIPVISLVDASGFASLREAAKLSSAYAEATTAKVTVVTGSAYGPVYIALAGRGANADVTAAWADASVSALSPETTAVFEWNQKLADSANPVEDRKKMIEEYRNTEATSVKAAADGLVEDVISPEETRSVLSAWIDMLSGKRVTTLPKKHANIQL